MECIKLIQIQGRHELHAVEHNENSDFTTHVSDSSESAVVANFVTVP